MFISDCVSLKTACHSDAFLFNTLSETAFLLLAFTSKMTFVLQNLVSKETGKSFYLSLSQHDDKTWFVQSMPPVFSLFTEKPLMQCKYNKETIMNKSMKLLRWILIMSLIMLNQSLWDTWPAHPLAPCWGTASRVARGNPSSSTEEAEVEKSHLSC